MQKRRLFIADESSPLLNSSGVKSLSPPRGGIHPALMTPSNVERGPKTPAKAMDENPGEITEKSPDILAASDSDSDPMEVPGFFSVSNQKLPYTKEEDELILKYVLKGQNIFRVSSISLWKHLEAKKENPKRTYQSLKNRFLRNIKPCLFTKFSHFIKDKDTTKKILSKFPELKQQMGRRETLDKIKLPERKPPQKVQEEPKVSSTSTNESEGNAEKTKPIQSPKPVPDMIVHSEIIVQPPSTPRKGSKSLNSHALKTVVYQRTVNMESDGISVLVNFKAKKFVDLPSAGIYKKFQQLEKKYKLVLCPTCGRYNRPKVVSPSKSCKESDILISSSLDSQNNTKMKPKSSKKQKGQGTNVSDLSKRSPCSPSLISEVERTEEIGKPSKDIPEGSSEVVQVFEAPKDASSGTDWNEVVSDNKSLSEKQLRRIVTRSKTTEASNSDPKTKNVKNSKRAKASSSKSNTEANSAKRFRENEEDLDSLCEEAMANFRKLINDEEEKLLVRKSLKKNLKSIGLEGVSHTDLESYFLDSSSDGGTPPLTIDYETDPQNTQNETEVESTGDSLLIQNMRKMLQAKLANNKNS